MKHCLVPPHAHLERRAQRTLVPPPLLWILTTERSPSFAVFALQRQQYDEVSAIAAAFLARICAARRSHFLPDGLFVLQQRLWAYP
jgi:hypothetical protein